MVDTPEATSCAWRCFHLLRQLSHFGRIHGATNEGDVRKRKQSQYADTVAELRDAVREGHLCFTAEHAAKLERALGQDVIVCGHAYGSAHDGIFGLSGRVLEAVSGVGIDIENPRKSTKATVAAAHKAVSQILSGCDLLAIDRQLGRESDGSEKLVDGPAGDGKHFFYRRQRVGPLEGKPWKLLDYLWGRRQHKAEYEDVRAVVWDYKASKGAIGNAASKITQAFEKENLPVECRVDSTAEIISLEIS